MSGETRNLCGVSALRRQAAAAARCHGPGGSCVLRTGLSDLIPALEVDHDCSLHLDETFKWMALDTLFVDES
jgi:hypothetical protein